MTPINIETFLSSFLGNNSSINNSNFTKEELDTLKKIIQKKAQYNKDRQFSLEQSLYDTPSEYRRSPDYELVTKDGKTYSSQEQEYSDRQRELKQKADSYKKNPNKVSVGYLDYGVKSGENSAPVLQNWLSALQQSYSDPAFRLASTLGSFNAYDEGNSYRVEDKYRFRDDQQWYYRNAAEKPLHTIIKNYWNQPGSLGEILFNKYKKGFERPVNLTIPK